MLNFLDYYIVIILFYFLLIYRIPLAQNISLEDIVEFLPLTLTGADFYALVTDAFYGALRKAIHKIEAGLLIFLKGFFSFMCIKFIPKCF